MYRKKNPHIVAAVFAFVIFDFCTLLLNYQITRQVEVYTLEINLAGRQRMLSQRVTKALLLAVDPSRSVMERQVSLQEAEDAYRKLQDTLSAFASGGEVVWHEHRFFVHKVEGAAALLVGRVSGVLSQWSSVPNSGQELDKFVQFMVERNSLILDSMNQLITVIENDSGKTVSDLRLAQSIAFVLSLGNFFLIMFLMQRARRRALLYSITDALTGLRNRSGIYQSLTATIEECHRTEKPLGVMLLDLDGFKAVNDTYGHAAGDEVLQEVSRRLAKWAQAGWICGRLGGDEFVVICPGLPAERLTAAAVELSRFLSFIPHHELTVSASVGAASCEPGSDADSMIAKADISMYAEKSAKRTQGTYRTSHR